MLRRRLHPYLAQMRPVWGPCWEGWMLGSQHSLLRDVCGGLESLTLASPVSLFFLSSFIDKILPRRHYMTCPLRGPYNSVPRCCSVPLPHSQRRKCRCWRPCWDPKLHAGTSSSNPPGASDSHMDFFSDTLTLPTLGDMGTRTGTCLSALGLCTCICVRMHPLKGHAITLWVYPRVKRKPAISRQGEESRICVAFCMNQ